MGNFYQYAQTFFSHLWPILTAGSILGLEEIGQRYWPWLREKLEIFSQKNKSRSRLSAILLAILYSGYLSWNDEHQQFLRLQAENSAEKGPSELKSQLRDLSKKLVASQDSETRLRNRVDIQSSELRTQSDRIVSLEPKPDRHLSTEKKQTLYKAFYPIRNRLDYLVVGVPMSDGEAYVYAKEYIDFFRTIDPKISNSIMVLFMQAPIKGQQEIDVSVRDPRNLYSDVGPILDALQKAGIKYSGSPLPTLAQNQTLFTILPNK